MSGFYGNKSLKFYGFFFFDFHLEFIDYWYLKYISDEKYMQTEIF